MEFALIFRIGRIRKDTILRGRGKREMKFTKILEVETDPPPRQPFGIIINIGSEIREKWGRKERESKREGEFVCAVYIMNKSSKRRTKFIN